MAIKKPRILFVFARNTGETSTRFGGFVKRIQKQGGLEYADVDYVALEDLIFHIKDEKSAQVYDPVSKVDLKNYSFVYFKSWQAMPELAASAAHYLEALGIPYADHQVRHEYIAKTTNYMAMWAQGVSVPETIWGSETILVNYLKDTRDDRYPLIIKAVHGQKGKDNFLVRSQTEALDILKHTEATMLLQQFIPNDGDYRIGVYGHRARWGIYRRSGGVSHLNNTSAGGSAEELDLKKVDTAILSLAEAASRACDLAVSGVDVVQDKETGKLYIFEANQGSQIVTGAFTESNMAAFDDGIKAMVGRRHSVRERRPRQIIGRHVEATIEDINHPFTVKAKVDTGAYQSSLHVEFNEIMSDEEGKEYVHYVLKNADTGEKQDVKAYEFWRARIKNSFGLEQDRFVVPMKFSINGVQYETRVSLADRSTQKYPLLIGRKLLQGNFLVNVEIGA